MTYINNVDFYKCISDYGKIEQKLRFSLEDDNNLTSLQKTQIEEEKKHLDESQDITLRNYVGKYFRGSIEISEIDNDKISAKVPGVIEYYFYSQKAYSDLYLTIKYNNSFREKLFSLKKGDNAKIEGKFLIVMTKNITLELISIEKSKSCFIATACYGNYNAPEVVVLREYRDNELLKTSFGKILVSLYYLSSPLLSTIINNSGLLKKIVKKYILQPIVVRRQNHNNKE